MISETLSFRFHDWRRGPQPLHGADLAIYFGDRSAIDDGVAAFALARIFPGAHIIGCSTGGQIEAGQVALDGATALALKFEDTRVRSASVDIEHSGQSEACGERLADALAAPDLAAVFVLSDGLKVNGSRLAQGLSRRLGPSVKLTGGLAGDGASFLETSVGVDDRPRAGRIGAVGFYGERIRVGAGSAGGWDIFGPRRHITASRDNVLLELDGEPALDLYERYLGEEAAELPGSGLYFPLRIADPDRPERRLARTILAIDREARSLTFAGDMPEGWTAQLMRGFHERLVAGAADAARMAAASADEGVGERAAILVSCIGRRLLLGQSAQDEVQAAGEALGEATRCVGFYSYGELAPQAGAAGCELHNQTMTITTLAEAA